jgi:hypothetical protein
MPAKSKNSIASSVEQSLRFDIKYSYNSLVKLVSLHYAQVEDGIYVRKSSGRMAHQTKYKDVRLDDCFDAVDQQLETNLKFVWKDDSYSLGRSLAELEKNFHFYNDVLKNDYTYNLILWKGGSMGVSDKDMLAFERSKSALSDLKKKIKAQFGLIRKYIKKIALFEKKSSSTSTSTTSTSMSIKAQRPASIASKKKKTASR